MAQPPPSPRRRKCGRGGGGGVQTMPLPKFSNRKSTDFKDTFSWNISHVVHEDRPNQQENSNKFCNGKRHTLLSFKQIQKKLREQYDQDSQ